MEIEIKSRSTGKVIYSFNGTFEDWNFKKKMILMGRDDDKKLLSHIEKYGITDFIALPVSEVLKEIKPKAEKPKETEIIEPEIKKNPVRGKKK